MNPYLELTLHVMAQTANLSYDDINWSDSTHLKLKWSESQENAFKRWFVYELKTNAKMRATMMAWPRKTSVKTYKKVADEFCNQHGFSYE